MDCGSDSSSKKFSRTGELLLSSSGNSKAAAAAAATLTKPTQLVACFMHLQRDSSVSYSFEFFKIQDLLRCKTLLRPTRVPWPEEENSFTDKMWVSFLHSSSPNDNDDDDDLGVLYAVCGVDSNPFCNSRQIPETLPNVLTRISLGGGYRMLDAYSTRMNAGKLIPLVAEIDHLIYVLSRPTNLFGPNYKVSCDNFEVYNPRDMSWKLLSDLPFITNDEDRYRSTSFFGYKYSHLVLGQKLFVSDMEVSSVYDITSNTWSACHLFSDCHIKTRFNYVPKPPLLEHCGPAFPFIGEALLWKGEFLLCIIRDENNPMAVYRIEKDDKLMEKAIPLKLRYEGTLLFPFGDGSQLVDIGDDHFALINVKMGEAAENYQDMMNIFTFKLETDATNQNCLIVKDLNKRYSKPDEINSSFFHYSFTC